MIDKIQYTDFNKFLVSTGYLLIALGVLLPFFFLKESFGLNIKQQELSELTDKANEIIIAKQNFTSTLITIVPYFSGCSFILGFGFLFYGGKKWREKQINEDSNKNKKHNAEVSKIETETKKAKFEYEQLLSDSVKISSKEVIENRKIEIGEETPDSTTIERSRIAQSYYLIESLIAEKFKQEYSNEYNILTNYRVNNQEYDIILKSINNDTNKLHFGKDNIVEIKYTTQKITKKYVLETLRKVSSLVKSYSTGIKKPIVIFVRANEEINFNEEEIRESIKLEWSEKTINKWNLLFLTIEEISEIKFRDKLK